MGRVRLLGRMLRIVMVVGLGLAMAATVRLLEWSRISDSGERRLRWSQAFMIRLSDALPFTVTVHGQASREPMLWVSNHVSWADIPLLGMLAPLAFLSKADVRSWPVAGWLAVQAGTLFIRRGAGDSQLTRRQMTLQLQKGAPVLIFPEGTTTDGRHLRTFHGRLLASAQDAGVALQPIAIRYVRDGRIDGVAPFIGDDDLLSHLMRLLGQNRAQVHIYLLAPIATTGKERAALAHECQCAVHAALFGEAPAEVARQAA
ncbi:lysophospholipid acyltransferase family protein [Pseudomonas sp. dw_358]|uniref:lysophospholipid acyltransferase family protein n=1 Tax=Pseudomonas sp. dw_358 TaxID=2720083 RepID=UPI001BD6C1D1|nr:lysophospholipid acyltransferase family protein [Pseudomonas sp. dw_358]